MTARCTYCRTTVVTDDDDTLPVCTDCALDPCIVGDRDQADADFQRNVNASQRERQR
jgi:hypothetical protein